MWNLGDSFAPFKNYGLYCADFHEIEFFFYFYDIQLEILWNSGKQFSPHTESQGDDGCCLHIRHNFTFKEWLKRFSFQMWTEIEDIFYAQQNILINVVISQKIEKKRLLMVYSVTSTHSLPRRFLISKCFRIDGALEKN